MFVLGLTTVVALVLAIMATGLKPIHDYNESIYNKKAILSAIESYLGTKASSLSDQEVQQLFEQQIEQLVVDVNGTVLEGIRAEDIDMGRERKKPLAEQRLPLYVFNSDGGKIYITSVRGGGLWDEIWGSIALKDDFNTIAGAAFDHKGETPGLGAEIKDNPSFAAQYAGRKLYDAAGNFISVTSRKGGIRNPDHEVDAISGATITVNGVNEMVARGIRYYEPFFKSLK